jgi:plasmid stability protein
MATLTIRNLPENVHALLKERARRNRRSLNQEVIAELSAVPDSKDDAARLAESRERMRRVTAEIDGIRERMTGFMSGPEIDAAIEEGRR